MLPSLLESILGCNRECILEGAVFSNNGKSGELGVSRPSYSQQLSLAITMENLECETQQQRTEAMAGVVATCTVIPKPSALPLYMF